MRCELFALHIFNMHVLHLLPVSAHVFCAQASTTTVLTHDAMETFKCLPPWPRVGYLLGCPTFFTIRVTLFSTKHIIHQLVHYYQIRYFCFLFYYSAELNNKPGAGFPSSRLVLLAFFGKSVCNTAQKLKGTIFAQFLPCFSEMMNGIHETTQNLKNTQTPSISLIICYPPFFSFPFLYYYMSLDFITTSFWKEADRGVWNKRAVGKIPVAGNYSIVFSPFLTVINFFFIIETGRGFRSYWGKSCV